MASKDLAASHLDILDSYYADNAKKLYRMVDRMLSRFGGLSGKDADDFYSLANEVFVDVMRQYIDTRYDGLRIALENIIRGNLTTTNTVVISAVTTLKDRKCVSLLSRSYPFSLSEYFLKICEAKEKEYISNNYGRRKANWC